MLLLQQRCANREKSNITNVNLVQKDIFHTKEDVSKKSAVETEASKKANNVYAPKVGKAICAKLPQNVHILKQPALQAITRQEKLVKRAAKPL